MVSNQDCLDLRRCSHLAELERSLAVGQGHIEVSLLHVRLGPQVVPFVVVRVQLNRITCQINGFSNILEDSRKATLCKMFTANHHNRLLPTHLHFSVAARIVQQEVALQLSERFQVLRGSSREFLQSVLVPMRCLLQPVLPVESVSILQELIQQQQSEINEQFRHRSLPNSHTFDLQYLWLAKGHLPSGWS